MSYDAAKYFNAPIKNGSSSNLAVNGSSTPVVFSLNLSANYDLELGAISIIAECSTLAFGNKFIDSTISTLTNGLLIAAKADDEVVTWQNCKRTRDIVEIAQAGGISMISGSPSLFKVDFWLPKQLKLIKTGILEVDDYFKATVQDDLRNLTFLEIFCQGVKL